jgi:hypothetical protein
MLKSIAPAEWSKNQHLRDFWRCSIFDFFDSIGQKRKWPGLNRKSVLPSRADIVRLLRHVRKVPPIAEIVASFDHFVGPCQEATSRAWPDMKEAAN